MEKSNEKVEELTKLILLPAEDILKHLVTSNKLLKRLAILEKRFMMEY